MRNPLKIVTRLSFVVGNSSIRHTGNCFSRKFSSWEKPSTSRSILKAIDVITMNRRTIISAKNVMHLVDKSAAKQFASLIIANRAGNSSYVIEMNSGLGFLSTELLEGGIPYIHIFEGLTNFQPNLNFLKKKYGERVCIDLINFDTLWGIAYIDWKEDKNTWGKYFESVVKRPWKDEPAIAIIGCLPDVTFIHRLTATIVHQNFLNKYGRMVLYVAVPPSVYANLICSNEHYDLYRPRIVMFQTLFTCELLGTCPRTAFQPAYRPLRIPKKRPKCRIKIQQHDGNMMNFIKIEAKPDVFDDDFTPADITHFYYFVNCNLRARKTRVIPALEKWIPGYGRHLIAQGFGIFTEFGELSPQEILKIFKDFRSRPEYKKSTFVTGMYSVLLGMNSEIFFDENSNELENTLQLPADNSR